MRSTLMAGALILLIASGPATLGFAGPSREGSAAAETIERGSGMAGTLVAIPKRVDRGGRIAAAVRNTGGVRMTYGLGFKVKRPVHGDWVSVPDAFTTEAVPDIGLLTQAGETGGPRYGQLVDRFRLRSTLGPGDYRLTKTVSRGFRGPSLRLDTEFEIVADRPRRRSSVDSLALYATHSTLGGVTGSSSRVVMPPEGVEPSSPGVKIRRSDR
jgi:hypothetical protein